jgi:hypothetical protein
MNKLDTFLRNCWLAGIPLAELHGGHVLHKTTEFNFRFQAKRVYEELAARESAALRAIALFKGELK